MVQRHTASSSQRLVAVTGGGGYIGSVLVGRLLDRGYAVRVIDTFLWGEAVLAPLAEHLDIMRADIRQLTPRHLEGVQAVIHLAGLSNDAMADYAPQANWSINVEGTRRVVDAAVQASVQRITVGSSASIYDGLDPQVVCDEGASVRPLGPYSTSKHVAEAVVLGAEGGVCPVVLRQASVYGFSPRMRLDLVVNTFVKDALLTGRLTLHGDGTSWRPLVDIRDVADAHIACLEATEEAVRGQIFNVVHSTFRFGTSRRGCRALWPKLA